LGKRKPNPPEVAIIARAKSTALVKSSLDPPKRTMTESSDIVTQHFSGVVMQALDLFRFSSHLRRSGQFSADQVQAIAEALAFGLINVAPISKTAEHDNIARNEQPEHNKTTAALLAIFLGVFGAHKFYLGKNIQGFLYLIFFWTLVPALLGFIEGLNYLSYSREEFTHTYG
jgi:TM2 domain-containing membrane protein YozV